MWAIESLLSMQECSFTQPTAVMSVSVCEFSWSSRGIHLCRAKFCWLPIWVVITWPIKWTTLESCWGSRLVVLFYCCLILMFICVCDQAKNNGELPRLHSKEDADKCINYAKEILDGYKKQPEGEYACDTFTFFCVGWLTCKVVLTRAALIAWLGGDALLIILYLARET